jgi:hypothetical protein
LLSRRWPASASGSWSRRTESPSPPPLAVAAAPRSSPGTAADRGYGRCPREVGMGHSVVTARP